MANSIDGRLVDATTRQPLGSLTVEAIPASAVVFGRRAAGDPIGSAVAAADGTFSIQLDARAFGTLVSSGADVGFSVAGPNREPFVVRGRPLWNGRRADQPVVVVVRSAADGEPAPSDLSSVQGVVSDEAGVAAPGLSVEVLDRNATASTLLGTSASGPDGHYLVTYEAAALGAKPAADIEVRVIEPTGERAELARSAIVYGAGSFVTVDVVVVGQSASRPSEFAGLLAAVQPVLGDGSLEALADLDAEGVAYVAGRAGWDARTVAMATKAATLSRDTQIPADHFYALLRGGVPGDVAGIARLDDAQIADGLRHAVAGGIIDTVDDAAIGATVDLHRSTSVATLAATKASTAVSTLGDMMSLRLDAAQQATFLDAYRTSGSDPAAMWQQLGQSGFDATLVTRLQTDAELGQMTRQNASVVRRLTDDESITIGAELADRGFYRADRWATVVGADVPDGVTAEQYTAGLAAQVAARYPTRVAADLVRSGSVAVGTEATPDTVAEVADFFAAHGAAERDDGATVAIGIAPVRSWEAFTGLSDAAKAGVQRIERLHQITPSNESMVALSQLGFGSARQVMRYAPDTFATTFGDRFPSVAEAKMVYQKAQQVHTTALSLAAGYLARRGGPNVYAITGRTTKEESAPVPEIAASATLEELFGNLDYCECEHCRSVLSPAAYLVELFEFLDVDDLPHTGDNPIAVLFERRPDLQHLALSCENTNVALPYIDIVNEVLEHYVVNGDLGTFEGHDTTDDVDTADLLADPQFVIDAAYDITRQAVYPFSLPFDMPLEHMRLLFEVWDSSLADALATFATAADARRERLRLDATQRSILTDVGFRELPEYFGEDQGTSIAELNAAAGTGKAFCRRTGITYVELAELLTTRFVNPSFDVAGPLRGIGVPLATIQARFDGDITDAGLTDLLPAGFDHALYGGDVLAWLDTNRERIARLITLTDVSEADADGTRDECDFGLVELRFALPPVTAPGPAANAIDEIAYHRLHRFIRLWKQLGWDIATTDRAVALFLGGPAVPAGLGLDPADLTIATIDAAFAGLLDRLANFVAITTRLDVPAKKLGAWLALWDTTVDAGERLERLAGLLRIGATDCADLVELSGVDPFADDLGADEPSMLRFVMVAAAVKASPLRVADITYLLRHVDRTGKLTPSVADLRRDLKALGDAISAVDAELAVAPATADLAAVAARMALVYDAAVVDRFVGLLSRSTTYSAPFTSPTEAVPAPLAAISPGLGRDAFRNTLTISGSLDAATLTTLDTAVDAVTLADFDELATDAELVAYRTDVKVALAALGDAGEADLAALGADDPELRTLLDSLGAVTDPAAQAAAVLDAILPELRAALRAASVRTALANAVKADADVVDAFTSGPDVLHADGDPATGVLADFLRLAVAPELAGDGTHAVLLDPAATGDTLLYVAVPEGTQVTVAVDGTTVLPATAAPASGEVRTTVPFGLSAGVLTPVEVTISGLPAAATGALRWRSKGLAKSAIPPSRLIDAAAAERASRSLLRMHKAVRAQKALGLTAAEVADLGGVRTVTAGLWNQLDPDGTIAAPALAAQFQRIAWVLWFAAWKAADEPDTDVLVSILRQPDLVDTHGGLLLAAVMEWKPADLSAVLDHFALTVGDLGDLANLRRVTAALELVGVTMQPAGDLISWSVPDPTGALTRDLRTALRARLDDAAWLETMHSVSDALRNARRTALVAHILHHRPPRPEIVTADHLYEWFLIDVEMDACMQTSRIRQALSTAQLFVNRCLLNLEPRVSPDSLRADHWQWMKRYRVWEANRKVFLYPENWLEPELRDGKSPFFRDLEGELLKADMTNDSAEVAFLTYLKKLDDVARLEIAGAYLEQRQAGNPDDDVLHVVGRTLGTTRQHWYRRYEYGYWTPWEKIGLGIEGDVVVPVVWKRRLFVFWLTTVVEAKGNPSQTPQEIADDEWSSAARVDVTVTIHRGELYRGAWTSPTSIETTVPITFYSLASFDPRRLRIDMRTYTPPSAAGAPPLAERLELRLAYFPGYQMSYILTFTSTNAPPFVDGEDAFWPALGFNNEMLSLARTPPPTIDANSYVYEDKAFSVRIRQPVDPTTPIAATVLTKSASLLPGFRVRPVLHTAENRWELPLFYSDERSVFFVSGDESVYTQPQYYADDFVLHDSLVAEIPRLQHARVKPVFLKPGDPLVNPVLEGHVLGDRIKVVIGDASPFVFGDTVFDVDGVADQFRFVGRFQ